MRGAPLNGPRCFTPRQARIVELIGDKRNLSYRQIGALLEPKTSEKGVKATVRDLSIAFFDGDTREAYPPRVQILVWIRHLAWELKRSPTLAEIIHASAQRDV